MGKLMSQSNLPSVNKNKPATGQPENADKPDNKVGNNQYFIMTFDEIIENAKETAGKRSKAFTDLKKAAPFILVQYASAMLALGFKNTKFKWKLFHDQAQYGIDPTCREGSLMFDFASMKLIEATEQRMDMYDEPIEVYNGHAYSLDFSENTEGLVLLRILESLQNKIEKCVAIVQSNIKDIENVLAKS